MNLRGMRWPEVLEGEPKLTVFPLRSWSLVMPEPTRVMKTDLKSVSSWRWRSGTTAFLERILA